MFWPLVKTALSSPGSSSEVFTSGTHTSDLIVSGVERTGAGDATEAPLNWLARLLHTAAAGRGAPTMPAPAEATNAAMVNELGSHPRQPGPRLLHVYAKARRSSPPTLGTPEVTRRVRGSARVWDGVTHKTRECEGTLDGVRAAASETPIWSPSPSHSGPCGVVWCPLGRRCVREGRAPECSPEPGPGNLGRTRLVGAAPGNLLGRTAGSLGSCPGQDASQPQTRPVEGRDLSGGTRSCPRVRKPKK